MIQFENSLNENNFEKLAFDSDRCVGKHFQKKSYLLYFILKTIVNLCVTPTLKV